MPEAHEFSWVTIDPDSMEFRVFAQEIDENGEPTGEEFDVTPDNFGRIAAQTTRQVMTQRIREVERDLKYEEYAGREGDIVTGMNIQPNGTWGRWFRTQLLTRSELFFAFRSYSKRSTSYGCNCDNSLHG